MERLEKLIELYLDDGLSPAEERELVEYIRRDRKAAQAFHFLYQQDRVLKEIHRRESSDAVERIMEEIARGDHALVGNIMEQVRAQASTDSPQTLRQLGKWLLWLRRPRLAFAACVLVTIPLWVLLFRPTVGEPRLAMSSAAQATLSRAGQEVAATDGLELRPNDLLTVAGTNAIAITYQPENTTLRLLPGSTLRLRASRGKWFELRRGRLEAVVARQQWFAPMMILTSDAEIRVLGTRFTLTTATNLTRLDVEEGKVRLTRAIDRSHINVPAAHFAVVAPDFELAALARTGSILREIWTNLPGADIELHLTGHPSFPNRPDAREWLPTFETTPDGGDDYGALWSGFLHPPLSGEYVFALDAADTAGLLLSPDAKAENKLMVLRNGAVTRESLSSNSTVSRFNFKAGRIYYIEVRHKAGKGRDFLAVSWKRPDGVIETIPGDVLSPLKFKKEDDR